jgi:LuxR family maltose regulon positive regulatory protein
MPIAEYQSQQEHSSILQAIRLIERLLKAAEAQKRNGSVIEILVAQALAHQVQGNLPLALASLDRAMILAEPEGYLRLFMDEGEEMRLLIEDFRLKIENRSRGQDNPLIPYIEKLLHSFAAYHSTISLSWRIGQGNQQSEISPIENQKSKTLAPALRSGAGASVENIVEPLSERELEVLKLLRTELSGPEIAGQLVISPNTFRTHTKNIFSKLGVNNRRAAVRMAEELDLF